MFLSITFTEDSENFKFGGDSLGTYMCVCHVVAYFMLVLVHIVRIMPCFIVLVFFLGLFMSYIVHAYIMIPLRALPTDMRY